MTVYIEVTTFAFLSAAQHMELHPEGLSEQQIVNWESLLVLFIFY